MKSSSFLRVPLIMALSAISISGLAQKKKTSLIGKTDIHALLEAAPAVPMSVEAAVSRAFGKDIVNPDYQALDNYYRPLFEKIGAAQQQFEAYREEVRSFQQEQGAEGLKKLALANSASASGPVLPDMPGMKGFMEKYMSDKAFAAQYDKMSEAQKEKVIKGFMEAEKPGSSTAAVPMDNSKFEKDQKDQNKIRVAMQIQEVLSELKLRMEKLTRDYENKVKALASGPGSYAEIQKAYDQEYAKIPLVVMGEGHVKEPGAMNALTAKDVAAKRARNAEELAKKAAWLTDLKAKYKLVVNDYNDLIQKYKGSINGSVKDLYNGTNTELGLADFEVSLMDLAGNLGRFSQAATEAAASMERDQYFRTRR
jgi:hypothetical protein